MYKQLSHTPMRGGSQRHVSVLRTPAVALTVVLAAVS